MQTVISGNFLPMYVRKGRLKKVNEFSKSRCRIGSGSGSAVVLLEEIKRWEKEF